MNTINLFVIDEFVTKSSFVAAIDELKSAEITVIDYASTEQDALDKLKNIEQLDILLTKIIDQKTMTAIKTQFPQLKIIGMYLENQNKSIEATTFIKKPFSLKHLITTIKKTSAKENLTVRDIDLQFKALSDATRRKILDLLKDSVLTAGELAELCQSTKPNISQHLKVLKNSGLVQEEKKGLYVYYSLCNFDFQQTKREVGKVLSINEKILFDIQQLAYKKNCEPVVGATDSQDDGTFYIMKNTETLISFHYSFRLNSFFINFEIPMYLKQGGSFHIRYEDTKAIEELYERITEELNLHVAQLEHQKEIYQKIYYELKKFIVDKTRNLDLFLTNDEEKWIQVHHWMSQFLEQNYPSQVNTDELADIQNEIKYDLFSVGKLHHLMEDPLISEIMVNAPDEVWIEKQGKLIKTNITFTDHDEVLHLARKIAAHIGRRVDNTQPILDARLPDGSKIYIVLPPVSRYGVTITIHKFSQEALSIDDLIKFGSINKEVVELIKKAIEARANILICGGAGAGKTASLNAFANHLIPLEERIITIEDTCELKLQHPNIVALETRPPNAEGAGEITLNHCMKSMRKLRADRFIIGELRQGVGFQFIDACNSNFHGALANIIAHRPAEALKRIENFIAYEGYEYPTNYIREAIANAVDLIIQVEQLRDGSRKITEITQINGYDKTFQRIILEPLYKWQQEGKQFGQLKGNFMYTGYALSDKLSEKFELYNIANPLKYLSYDGTEKELDMLENELPHFVGQLAEALHSGFNLNEAIRYTHDITKNVTSEIFYNFALSTDAGTTRLNALLALKNTYKSPLLHFLLHAMMIQENLGGPMALLLRQMIPFLEERNTLLNGKARNEKEDFFVSDNWQFMEFLDLIACIIPSGGSFSHAVELIYPYLDNRYSHEFNQAVAEYKAGKTLRNALTDTASRLNNDNVHTFVLKLNQSEEIGLNIVDTVKEQANAWRKKMFHL